MFQYLQARNNQMFLLLANIANSGTSENSLKFILKVFNFKDYYCFAYMQKFQLKFVFCCVYIQTLQYKGSYTTTFGLLCTAFYS